MREHNCTTFVGQGAFFTVVILSSDLYWSPPSITWLQCSFCLAGIHFWPNATLSPTEQHFP